MEILIFCIFLSTLTAANSIPSNSSAPSARPTNPTPVTPATTTKATKVIFFQSTTKPRVTWNLSEAIGPFLEGYTHTVQNMHLDFYKFKVKSIQNFLETTIPSMEELRNDVTDLVQADERGGALAALANVKARGDFLDSNLMAIETKFGKHETLNQEFNEFIQQTKNHFQIFRQNFDDIFENQISSLSTKTKAKVSGPCGGLVDLSLTSLTRLNYTVVDRQSISCVWAIWTAVQDQIKVTGLQVEGDATVSFHYYDSESERMRQISNIDTEEIRLNHAMIFLVFSSTGSRLGQSSPTGFRLNVQSSGSHKKNIPPVVKFLPDLTPENDTMSAYLYPESGKYYSNYEKIFFIGQPSQNRQMALAVTDLELQVNGTGPCCDVLSSFTFSNHYNQFQFRKVYMGNFIPSYAEEIFGSMNQPVLLYFQSDHNTTNKGFTITYGNK